MEEKTSATVSGVRMSMLSTNSVQNSRNPNALQNWLTQQHYTQWTSYEPASRFWHFQLIEGGWLLALSVVLIAAAIWLVRRRAA